MISFLAGAIINQMYILAITGKLQDKPTILAIDEFSRVETKVTKDILTETRKFNLAVRNDNAAERYIVDGGI